MLTNLKCVLCLILGAAGSMSGLFAVASRIYPFGLAVLVLAPCAIALGIWGRCEIRHSAWPMRGKSAALAGIWCAVLDLVVGLLLPAT
jgi:hypothetical protein